MVNYNDPRNYKDCRKKQYTVYVCKPEIGTIVINKLEQADTWRYFLGNNNPTWKGYSPKKLEKLKERYGAKADELIARLYSAVQAGKAYITTEKTPFVICGTRHEAWVISAQKLASTYCFLSNGKEEPINNSSFAIRCKKDLTMPWTAIQPLLTNGQATTMACFVPIEQQFQIVTSRGTVLNGNMPNYGSRHGKGDFIVCTKGTDGRPMLQDSWIVNGMVFKDTYNNQGWTECLAKDKETHKEVTATAPVDQLLEGTDSFPTYKGNPKCSYKKAR